MKLSDTIERKFIESFDINKYLTVFDSYDQNPIIKYFIKEGTSE